MTLASTVDRGVYVAAELSANHGGRVSTAIAMIDSCGWAGVSAVKTQRRDIPSMDPEILDAPYLGPHSFGDTYRAHREALELSLADQQGLCQYARDKGIEFACSAWDINSARDIRDSGFDWIKIPSALAVDLALLHEVAAFGMPVVISFGGCSAEDVRRATEALDGAEVYGLQCTVSYPMKHEDAHLSVIPSLHAEYVAARKWRAVGYSDHSSGIVLSAAAVALGARVIERHTSLDRTSKGTDHAASLEPDGLRRVVRDCAAVLSAMGDGTKRVLPVEEAAIKKLRPGRLRK